MPIASGASPTAIVSDARYASSKDRSHLTAKEVPGKPANEPKS